MWIVWLEKKILKTLGIILGIIIILVTALHIYVVNNAEKLIEDLVKTQSKNKLRLKLEKIKFNYFSRKVELQNVAFYSNDSLDLNTSYRFKIDNIKLRVKALVPIFTRKELLIDSIFLTAPQIEVTRLKPPDSSAKKELSIPEEMGRIYNSIIDALTLFQVSRFELNDGKFTLQNKIRPDQVPLTISNLHVHIDNFKVDSTTDASKLLVGDQMVFRTRNQDIMFPDGKHRLAFSRFRINIRKKIIEIDSCTLSGKGKDNNRSGFNFFMDTLKLMNVDFKALYENELIKADSVFCRNPNINLVLEQKAKIKGKAKLPNIDKLIQELTGDLLLNYIGVTNATVDVTSYKNGEPTTFSSDHNNFEMTGLSIDQNSSKPVSLEGFDMAIHNYENFLKDSSHVIRFDSIRLRENRILLSNFSVNTEPFKDNRNIKVQQFALSGLSWENLIFNRKVIARQATLLNPQIDFVQPEKNKSRNKRSTAYTLDVINNFMDLDKLQVINGQIKINTKDKTELQLENANVLINIHKATSLMTVPNIQNSVEDLNFSKGTLKLKDLIVNMNNSSFNHNTNTLTLEKLDVHDWDQTFNISSKNTVLENVRINDSVNFITADGLNWSKASVEINSLPKEKKSDAKPLTIILKNLAGNNTAVDFNSEKKSFFALFENISATTITKDDKIVTENLQVNGNSLIYFSQKEELTANTFSIKDLAPSFVRSINLKQKNNANTVNAVIPELTFTPDINSFITGKPDLKNMKLTDPSIDFKITEKTVSKESKPMPDLSIDSIIIERPSVRMENSVSKGLSLFEWNGNNDRLFLKNIQSSKSTNQLSVASLTTDISNISFADSLGKQTNSKKVTVNTTLENILFHPGEKPFWSASMKELIAKNFAADSLGKKPAKVIIDQVKIENLMLGSDYTGSLAILIKKNPLFIVSNISGSMIDQKNNWQFHNLRFTRASQNITLDSFSYHPVPDQHTFVAASPFQTDYMTFKSGNINISGVDIDRYLSDSTLQIGNININSPYFTTFRDKRPPFNAGIIKPFLSKVFQKIPQKLSIDTVLIKKGTVVYTELNNKTNETGIVPVTRISGDIFPIKNYNVTNTDSLRIRLNGYLMDTAWLRLRVRESYLDSLSGFLITLRMRPGSLLYLNPVLEPLASVKIQSGFLDTLSLRAVGQEYISLGEIKMYYHDLKVQFLRNDSEDKKRFLKGLMTFVANSFVIKNSNKRRTGVVYFPRLRDRSFINYYIKITMSGVASSVGAKKNRKLIRKYRKQLKSRQLPPIDFD